ncbi:Heat shock factor (HSF)-type, DNA-binding [Cynara cardunculus var. scolymus]|uniref:Heat shock factor (HSF)-type, DNA-binding n=1 Tax=Cynara cardunculus var. scolymus TaxID=59895 RepID=A0A103XUC5_CYNCS|nr:Heat shock factor (HSF)-type, DNA-binding [Cynara cardunculus var. scolymus]
MIWWRREKRIGGGWCHGMRWGTVSWCGLRRSRCYRATSSTIISPASFVNSTPITYGFKKTSSKRWEFKHEKIQKGHKHLLMEIIRKKCEASGFPACLKPETPSSASSIEDQESMLLLMEENKNLKRETMELQMEIQHMKSLEIKLTDCVSQYMGSTTNHQYQYLTQRW